MYLISKWSEIADREISDAEKSIKQILNYTQQKLILSKDRFVGKLQKLDNSDFNILEKTISEDNSNNLLISILDDKNNLKFWNGLYHEQITKNDTLNYKVNETYFLNTDLNNYLAITDTVIIGNERLILRIAEILENVGLSIDYSST